MRKKSSRLGSACRLGKILELRAGWAIVVLLVGMWVSGGAAVGHAQVVLSVSPDITIALGAGGVVSDEDVIVDNQLGIALLEDLGPLPAGSEVVAFGLNINGQPLIAFETTTLLPGGIVARPGDVIRYQGGASYKIAFSGAAEGLPSHVAIDAVSGSENLLILGFDTTVDLGGGLVAADEDLVSWDGSGFASAFKASSTGIHSALDVDAAHYVDEGRVFVSFDTSGEVGGIAFDDEDVLLWDALNWSMEFDASASYSAWSAGDLDALAVPEPGFLGMISLGSGWLGWMSRRRRPRR